MARQNVKEKYLMYQIPIKMLKQHAVPNSSLQNLKIYSAKGYRKEPVYKQLTLNFENISKFDGWGLTLEA